MSSSPVDVCPLNSYDFETMYMFTVPFGEELLLLTTFSGENHLSLETLGPDFYFVSPILNEHFLFTFSM